MKVSSVPTLTEPFYLDGIRQLRCRFCFRRDVDSHEESCPVLMKPVGSTGPALVQGTLFGAMGNPEATA